MATKENMNAINVIFPYLYNGQWVFDDEAVGLEKEPFICGADEIIDKALEVKKIDPKNGCQIIFSGSEFPNADVKFEWVREGSGGNWYWSEDFSMEGWLCPALLKYFDEAPKILWTEFKEKK